MTKLRFHLPALLLALTLPHLHAQLPVDPSTLSGKVMCGYQGWFNATGDGANRGYHHWANSGKNPPSPDNITIDLWPDLSELAPEERYPSNFKHADGSTAELFSSHNQPTVHRHFRWMQDYGIHGVFLQRFASTLRHPPHKNHNDTVLGHVRTGSKKFGRTYALMYDTSGLRPGQADHLLDDWRGLVRETRLTADKQYLQHRGKPVLALWGCGFDDGSNRPSLGDWRTILTTLKNDPACANPTIVLGIPTYWRDLHRDSVSDPELHALLKLADVLSPWTIGRYRTPHSARRHTEKVVAPDLAWCARNNLGYLPVAFPGFSWHNLSKRDGNDAPIDQIPRLEGQFFQSQIDAYHTAGAAMLYVAMFDEVDEATAVFKCTNNPPLGTPFSTYEGLPPDHYLKLTGQAAALFSK